MRKLKGVMAAEPFEDPKATFKYQSLLQDYQDLQKETDAKMKKMQMMNQRKMILAAEVRFLRKRCEYLTKNKTLNLRQIQIPIQQKYSDDLTSNRPIPKKRNYTSPNQRAFAGSETKKKARVAKAKKATLPIFDLNHDDMDSLPSRNPTPISDLNHKERSLSGKDTAALFFDLNQISRDEEELQMSNDPSRNEDQRTSLVTGCNDEQLNEMKLSGCRTVGSGSSRAGKRKITWQDQVALRV